MTDIYQGDPRLFLRTETLIREAFELKSDNDLWPDIVALYHFNGDYDDAKNSNDGTRHGTGTEFDTDNQKLGSACAKVNGIDAYISIPQDASLDISGNATIVGWFRLDNDFNSLSGTSQILIEKYQSNSHNFHLALVGIDYNQGSVVKGSLVFKIKQFEARYAWTQQTSWEAGKWYFFAVVIDASDGSNNKIYIDAIDDTDNTAFSGDKSLSFSAGWNIGGKDADSVNLSGERFFGGLLDEIAIFDRALLRREITKLYGEQIKKISKISGSSLKFTGGQPVLDRGLENLALISLFTAPGWCGNVLFQDENQKLGSKVEEIANQPITLQMINDLRNAAERALDNPIVGNMSIEINNPSSYRLEMIPTLQPPGQDIKTLLIAKNGLNWIEQARDPAYLRG